MIIDHPKINPAITRLLVAKAISVSFSINYCDQTWITNWYFKIQNVPCGTNGVTCAKSITLRVGSGENQEVVHFSKNKPPPSKLVNLCFMKSRYFINELHVGYVYTYTRIFIINLFKLQKYMILVLNSIGRFYFIDLFIMNSF